MANKKIEIHSDKLLREFGERRNTQTD